jgi:hypothetical protein
MHDPTALVQPNQQRRPPPGGSSGYSLRSRQSAGLLGQALGAKELATNRAGQ